MFDVYLITPDRDAALILATARELLAAAPAGRVALQLRSNTLTLDARVELAHALAELARTHGAAFLVSADLALARAVAADGVQLPEHAPTLAAARAALGAAAYIGASRHDRSGVAAAERGGASFVTLSPVFALGGIDAARAVEVVRAGAHGVAVIREVWDSPQPARALAGLLAGIDAAR